MRLFLLLLSTFVAEAFVSQQPRSTSHVSFHGTTGSTALSATALIVQNKGGGHGELGYQLAKLLQNNDKISSITILQDDACKDKNEPFCSYATDLPNVKIIKAPLSSDDDENMNQEKLQSILGAGVAFDYVWDNASKNASGAGKAICDLAKAWNVKLLCYVSSAGIYQPAKVGAPMPMPEATTPIKESAGQTLYDQYAKQTLGLPLVSFRPQYIYGPKANKHDYIDWYMDRLVRDLPLPIPGDGTQLVSLTCSEDVASLLAAPLQNEAAAIEQCYFNCGTNQLHSYNDVAYLCADAAGIARDDVKLEHYDSDLLGKGTFPFRMTDFYVAPTMAMEKLGWKGAQHDLAQDLKEWYYDSYKARGGPSKKMSLVKDWEIVIGHKTPVAGAPMGSIYDKYDPLVLEG
jgi:nucleoside-diphosphate-sugar epimerase